MSTKIPQQQPITGGARGRHLTVLPPRLTAHAIVHCPRYRADFNVGQCSARYLASDRDDTCHGCEHGAKTSAAMRGAKDELELARERARKKAAWDAGRCTS